MKPTIKSHRSLKALTNSSFRVKPRGTRPRGLYAVIRHSSFILAALLLALASVHIASAQTNNTDTGVNAGASNTTGDDNTSDGFSALQSNKIGIRNTAVGSVALKTNIAGNYNTAVGYGALTVSIASGNTALGYAALIQNTSGTSNTASGVNALFSNTIGNFNTATGRDALHSNLDGASNVAVGYQALYNNTNGGFNVAIGDGALLNITSGSGNIALGEDAGLNLTAGSNNISIGTKGVPAESGIIRIGTTKTSETVGLHTDTFLAGVIHGDGTGLRNIPRASLLNFSVGTAKIANGAVNSSKLASNLRLTGDLTLPATTTGGGAILIGGSTLLHSFGTENVFVGLQSGNRTMTGSSNTAIGVSALRANTSGSINTACGFDALRLNTTGSRNTAVGLDALFSNTSGVSNTAIGVSTLFANTTGSGNIALGNNAGKALTTGSNNIDIGNDGVAGESNTIRIGVQGTQTATFVAGISGKTAAGGVQVFVNSSGQLGTLTSSRRFKQDIASMDGASDALLSLRPVTFRYKTELDPESIPQFGLIAEEVDKIAPELVARDAKGEIYTVRYEAVNAMLLNEFLKEHARVEAEVRTNAEQTKTIAQQEKQILALAARLSDVTERLDRMARSMEETKAPGVGKILHRAPASY